MKKLLLLTLLATGCGKDGPPEPGVAFEEDSILIKDYANRCLYISTRIEVSGVEHFQTGRLNIRIMPEGWCEGVREHSK